MLALTLVHTVLHRHDGGDDPARQLQEEEEEGGKKTTFDRKGRDQSVPADRRSTPQESPIDQHQLFDQ